MNEGEEEEKERREEEKKRKMRPPPLILHPTFTPTIWTRLPFPVTAFSNSLPTTS